MFVLWKLEMKYLFEKINQIIKKQIIFIWSINRPVTLTWRVLWKLWSEDKTTCKDLEVVFILQRVHGIVGILNSAIVGSDWASSWERVKRKITKMVPWPNIVIRNRQGIAAQCERAIYSVWNIQSYHKGGSNQSQNQLADLKPHLIV